MERFLFILCLVFTFVFLCHTDVYASNMINAKQTKCTEDSVTIDVQVESDYYKQCIVGVYSDAKFSRMLSVISFYVPNAIVEKSFENLSPTSTYYLRFGLGMNDDITEVNWITSIPVITAMGNYSSKLEQTGATNNSATIEVDEIQGATYYNYQLLNSSNSIIEQATSKKRTYTFSNLDCNKKYKCVVTPIRSKNGFTTVSDYYMMIDIECLPNTPKSIKCDYVDTRSGTAGFTIDGDTAEIYKIDIYYLNGDKVLSFTSNDNNPTIKDTKLLDSSFFKVRVSAGVDLAGKKFYTNKTKFSYFTSVPSANVKRISNKKISISWDKVKGADYYNVYFYKRGDVTNKVANKVTTNSVKVNYSTARGKVYIVEVRPVTIVNDTAYKSVSGYSNSYSLQIKF